MLDANAHPQKSTIGRAARPVRAPGWVRGGLQFASVVAPGVAAQVASKIFFTPPRPKVNDDERQVLARGATFTVKVMGGLVRGWSFGEGPTVLLVHGWGGHAGQMSRFVMPLVEAGFRVVAVDLPGHGESEGTTSTLVHGARTLLTVANLFGPVHGVVAHSFGTATSGLAMAWGLHVERAVFIAPSAGFEGFWERFRQGTGVSLEVWNEVVRRAETKLEVKFEELVPVRLAPRQEAQLLVIHDRGDKEVPFEDGVELTAAWPKAQLVETTGLGHMRILKDAGVIERAVGALW